MGLFNFFRNTVDINTSVAEYETNDGAVLLDVRTAEEYRDGHIDGSVNIPLDRISSVGIPSRTKAHRFMCIV